MPVVAKSKNTIWRIFTGPTRTGKLKKEVGFVVAANIRADKLPASIKTEQLKNYLAIELEKIVRAQIGD